MDLTEEELYCDVEIVDSNFIENQSTNQDEDSDFSEDYDYSDVEQYYQNQDTYHKAPSIIKESQHSNLQHISNKLNDYQPNDTLFRKYVNKINVSKYEGPSLSSHAANLLIQKERKMDNERIRTKDKHDRATAEQVMDPRTRMILFKLLNRGVISEINGCISTDRDRYVSGEFRFRNGYCKHNPRKMVRTWAEKEMRNLVRMYSNGLSVPKPILLRSHVLVMSFIGKDGWPAPLLKDAEISQSKYREIYREVIILMWKMYNKCKLVHADLSEFNMLYQNESLYIIDVSQSVEHDHPHALDFLRKDCTNVTEFFRRKEVATMSIKQLFDFITDPCITEPNLEEYLDKLSEEAAEKPQITSKEQVEEEVFKNAYIPKRLTEVIDIERDITLAKSGGVNDLVYKTITGLKITDASNVKESLENSESSSDTNDDNSDVDSDSTEDGKTKFFEDVYIPSKLQNWQIPKWYPERPCAHKGKTQIIANDRGHLLPGIPSSRKNMWGEYTSTWDLPKKITRKLACELSAPKAEKLSRWNKHCIRHKKLRQKSKADKENLPCNNENASADDASIKDEKENNKEESKEIEALKQNDEMSILKDLPLANNQDSARYVPGDLTDPKNRDSSYYDLKAGLFEEHADKYAAKGYPKSREDFSATLPQKTPDLKTEVDNILQKQKKMSGCKCTDQKKESTSLPSPYLAAIKNFILAKKLHKENLEHVPLPDTITDAMYRKRQMMGDSEPGLLLKDGNYATGVGWKGYPGYGATRCTKLRVYRPKTCSDTEKAKEDRPGSVSSFDKKWRFIRQKKVTPIELAICWDLTPMDRNDEPKRPIHIDGSNGSQAPAVFSLVHTPKDENEIPATKTFEPLFDKVNKNDVEHACYRKDCKTAWESAQPIYTSSHKTNSSNSSVIKRSKSAYNIDRHSDHGSHEKSSTISSSIEKQHKSSPNLSNSTNSCKYCGKERSKRSPSKRVCVACELKNAKPKQRPKSEFKMAFKAGVPNNNKSSGKRHEYPDHWRLASIYQHSYKPLHLRKRPMIECVFK
ncbi:hypothetical protein Trydic_g9604 [Trypoxylus dichotomus]